MNNQTWIRENILRIIVPYKDIDTTIYVLRAPGGLVVFDTASSYADIEQYLLPALAEEGLNPEEIRYVFISHNHRDHAPGLGRVLEAAPEAVAVSRSSDLCEKFAGRALSPEDGTELLGVFRVVTIPGHTADSAALLDTRTGTLVTGDCLQLFGIYGSGAWGANITLPEAHLQAVEKVRSLPVEEILCAHDYHPLGREITGRDKVAQALDACVEPLKRIRGLILEHPALDDAGICACYHQGEYLPTVGEKVAAAMRLALSKGTVL